MSDDILVADASGTDLPQIWVPDFRYGVTALTDLSASDVTLTSLEAAKDRISLAGALTSNISIILPTWLNTWKVTNNCTGSYTVTIKTSAGAGVAVEQDGEAEVYGDGTNILIAAQQIGVAVNDDQAVTLGQAKSTFAALAGSDAQQFSAATATSADQVVNLSQMETYVADALDGSYAAINGSSSELFNVAAATASTNAVNLGQFAASMTRPGYSKLPNGLIMQWADFTVTTAGVQQTLTLPVPLPTAILAVMASSTSVDSFCTGGTNGTLTGVYVSSEHAGAAGTVLVIGY